MYIIIAGEMQTSWGMSGKTNEEIPAATSGLARSMTSLELKASDSNEQQDVIALIQTVRKDLERVIRRCDELEIPQPDEPQSSECPEFKQVYEYMDEHHLYPGAGWILNYLEKNEDHMSIVDRELNCGVIARAVQLLDEALLNYEERKKNEN